MSKLIMSKKNHAIRVLSLVIILSFFSFLTVVGENTAKDVADIYQDYENIPAVDNPPIGISDSERSAVRRSGLPPEKKAAVVNNNLALKRNTARAETPDASLPHTGDTVSFWLDEEQVEFTVAAVNEYCALYVPSNTSEGYISEKALAEFYPVGGTPTKSAAAIILDYKNNIYNPMLNTSAPQYYGRVYDNQFVSILLYDINKKHPDNSFSGFFYDNDLTSEDDKSNNRAIVHIDIGQENGYDSFLKTGVRGLNGTLAHELQHLINYSEVLYNNNAEEDSDTWLNEGLSGTADILYANEIERAHFFAFLADEYGPGLTYVPTDEEWEKSDGSVKYYGSAAIIMEQYALHSLANLSIQPFHKLLTDYRSTSDSKLSVGDNYFENINRKKPPHAFDSFFNRLILDLAVDSKFTANGVTYDYRYRLFSSPDKNVGNMWYYRQKYREEDTENDFFKESGLKYYEVGDGEKTFDLDTNSAYKPDLKLLKLTDDAEVNLTILDSSVSAAGSGAKYYIIYPENQEEAGSLLADWINNPRTFKELEAGVNYLYRARTGSYFAILAVGFSSPVTGSVKISEITN